MVAVRMFFVVMLLVAIPVPAQATTSGRSAVVTVYSIGRDASGRLTLDVSVRVSVASGYGCAISCEVTIVVREAWTQREVPVALTPDASGRRFTGAVMEPTIDAVGAAFSQANPGGSADVTPWVAVKDALPKWSLTLNVDNLDRDDSGNLQWDITIKGRYLQTPGGPCDTPSCVPGIVVRYADTGGTETIAEDGQFGGDGGPVSHRFTGSRGMRQIDAIRPYLSKALYNEYYGAWVPVEDKVPTPFSTLAVDTFTANDRGGTDYDLTVRGKYLADQAGATCTISCFATIEAKYADDPEPHKITEPVEISRGDKPLAQAMTGSLPASASPIVALRSLIYGESWNINNTSTPTHSDWIPLSGNVKAGHDLDSALTLITAAVGNTSGSCLMLFPVGTHAGGSSLNDQQLACESGVLTAGKSFTAYVAGYLKTLSSKQIARLLVTAGIHTAEKTAKVSPDLDYGKTLPAGCLWTSIRTISCTNAGMTSTFPPISAPPQQDFLYQANQFAKSKQANSDIIIPPAPASGIITAPTDHAAIDDYRVLALDTCEVQIAQTEQTDDLDADDCTTMPIFFTGTDVQEATNHDYDVIQAHPELMQLTYVRTETEKADVPRPDWRSSETCKGRTVVGTKKQCDEYPFFSTEEGFPDAMPDLRVIAARDNLSQGGKLSQFYRGCPVLQTSEKGSPGRRFLVVPWVLPTMAWCPK